MQLTCTHMHVCLPHGCSGVTQTVVGAVGGWWSLVFHDHQTVLGLNISSAWDKGMAEAGYRVEQRETGTGPSRCSHHVPLPCALGISPSTLPRRHLSGILRCGPLTHRGRRGWGGDQEEVSLEPPPRLFFCPCEDFGWLPTHHGLSAPFPINPQTQNVVAILWPWRG